MGVLKKCSTLVLCAMASFSLVACSSNSSQNSEVMDWNGVQKEYDATVANFPYDLPEGVSFPVKIKEPRNDAVYQQGNGIVKAYFFWECSWMDQALTANAAGDTAAFNHAIAQLENGLDSIFRTKYYEDPDRIWADKALGKAKLGDITTFAAFYEGDCKTYRSEMGK